MPVNYPRITDTAGFDYLQEVLECEELGLLWLKLWDAVVTLLHTTASAHLRDLLDLDREEVMIIVGNERRGDKIVIWRKRGDVLVGGFMDNPKYGL
ncbi:hypothetical protein G6514_009484 [Epicoccum nigrum]|nr:hypothetical protein G6514_009484 [Epicoccum nigrum]